MKGCGAADMLARCAAATAQAAAARAVALAPAVEAEGPKQGVLLWLLLARCIGDLMFMGHSMGD